MPKNVLEAIITLWEEHAVEVTLPGRDEAQRLILVEVQALTSLHEMLMDTYRSEVTDLHFGLSEKVFGKDKTWVTFGVFFNPDSRTPVYAFCRNFADFDAESGKVVFKDINDVLLNQIDYVKPVQIQLPKPPKRPTGPSGGGMVLRYAVPKRPDEGDK